MLSKAFVRSCAGQRQVAATTRRVTVRQLRQRRFCTAKNEEAVKEAAKEGAAKPVNPTPPPPPGSEGGGSGMYLVGLAALAGGGYYFKDEISKQLGLGETKAAAELKSDEIKKELVKLEEKLEKVEQVKEEVKPVQVKPVATETSSDAAPSGEVDWEKLREAITDILDDDSYDDGSYGPVFVRLAWHSAGTYSKKTKKGGSEGAAMRFAPESEWGANAGLDVARAKLEPIKAKFPGVSYSDLWSFAGTVAIEEMGGPTFKWRPGRKDHLDTAEKLPDGLLPDPDGRGKTEAEHLRDIFYRMGFNDKEIVCLSGAHALGRCHEDRSGFWGPWTYAPTTFSNEYYRLLLEERWSKKMMHNGSEWKGPEQYENPNGQLMMLPSDMSLVWDEKFLPYVKEYAADEEKFFADFAKVWIKLQENGVKKFNGWRRYIFFGPRE
mmetsp:Transcript_11830/g.13635  ORF Transcript_11830/g.13635 Transcript_11830/m.13635 type:complete len:436 (+) Transcript_11830:127-1434(+)